MDKKTSLIRLFPANLRPVIEPALSEADKLYEIRLRNGSPIIVYGKDGERFLSALGRSCAKVSGAYITTPEDIDATIKQICDYSIYAYEEELKEGFISVIGGHRVGVCGRTLTKNGQVTNLRYISALNIRVSHEIKGAAENLLPYIYKNKRPLNCCIISPPGQGKTTLLRDMIRYASDGSGFGAGVCVGVADERGEIAASHQGIAGNDLGIRTVVMDGCPKAAGMMMLIRSMNPRLIACDEIGGADDAQALDRISACGCGIFMTIHASDMDEVKQKTFLEPILYKRTIDRWIVLKGSGAPGKVSAIYDGNYELMWATGDPFVTP